ncbi:hypothetical protein HY572_01350 [Candidatus Micrarchaeota archaeon]|nr:hypothetical protein [Candidatus Micrarchaeota archaeon]
MKRALLVLLSLLSVTASAHLEAGIDEVVGPYQLDVGWDPVAPNVGEKTVFAINVVNPKTRDPAALDRMFVRLEKGETVYFSGNLDLQDGGTQFSYQFPHTGVWNMHVEFDGYKADAEVFVPGAPPSSESLAWVLAAGLALCCGYLLWKKKN